MEAAAGPDFSVPPRFSVSDHPGGHVQLACSIVPPALRSYASKRGPAVPMAPGAFAALGEGGTMPVPT